MDDATLEQTLRAMAQEFVAGAFKPLGIAQERLPAYEQVIFELLEIAAQHGRGAGVQPSCTQ